MILEKSSKLEKCLRKSEFPRCIECPGYGVFKRNDKYVQCMYYTGKNKK